MSQVQLSPELARGVLQLARALLIATRNWSLYPPEHPTVGQSVARLADAVRKSSLGAVFSLGITPDTLLVEGAPADQNQAGIAEAAAMLHDRDLLQITFLGDPSQAALHAFLRILTLDPAERRRRGGPARIWQTEGDPCLALEQIDYQKVLARDEGDTPEPAKRDDLWKAIIMSIAGGQKAVFDERAQQRLLQIAGSPLDIGDLATAVMAPKCTLDGSPLVTSQAATVLAAFRHLTGIVSVMSPERLPEVMGNLATAALQLDPHVMMQVLQSEDDPAGGVAVVSGMAAAFDDSKVAQLLATALALDGRASDRLATIFNTIAPDEDRKRRVLTLTRHLVSETDFGRAGQFQALWTSMEELLISYNDKPFVSEAYRTALDGVGGRADKMAVVDLPPDLPDWMESLGQANVRKLSVTMLIDLLTIERDPKRAGEIAEDMVALSEDLLMSGAYDDAKAVIGALAARAASKEVGRDEARHALDRLGESLAMRETAALLGDIDEAGWPVLADIFRTVGVSTAEALKPVIMVETETIASRRAEDLITGFGAAAVTRLAPLVADSRWFVQSTGAKLLGRTRSPAAVPLLQPLLRKADARVARVAIGALGGIDDPSAARAVHTVLRSATGPLRRAVIEALVADRDPRVVPMLIRIVDESQPLGKDHDVVVETLSAFGRVGTDRGIPTIVSTISRRGWFGRKKLHALKVAGVEALGRIDSPAAAAALEEAARSGDRMLKKILTARRT
ncbi:MAG: HEAT repeat domain-containing protein [Acidobacteria bacterium]|nr:HEAT repeat domain-containing protein [Acidobacteriota bacterium]